MDFEISKFFMKVENYHIEVVEFSSHQRER